MSWYLALPSLVLAVLLVLGGVAALRTGRLLPWQRRHVYRTELFGGAQLVMAAAFTVQAAAALLDDRGVRRACATVGILGILCGLVLVVLAQRPRQDR
ncbi:hypothetical protein AB0424_01630 [Streptomyces sp. NPDC051180]|uniref:hypothetical protein n=1 Tax=Streptomyces sp. NPDC051180 TaxID=3155797 RepID=UPI00344B6ADA